MELATIINFFIILFIFAIIPGPATFAVLSTSTRYSLIASILLAAGVTVGDLVYTSAVLFSFSLFEEILTPISVLVPGDREVDLKRLQANLAGVNDIRVFEEPDFAKFPGLVKGYNRTTRCKEEWHHRLCRSTHCSRHIMGNRREC